MKSKGRSIEGDRLSIAKLRLEDERLLVIGTHFLYVLNGQMMSDPTPAEIEAAMRVLQEVFEPLRYDARATNGEGTEVVKSVDISSQLNDVILQHLAFKPELRV